jgi:hypothetical protein
MPRIEAIKKIQFPDFVGDGSGLEHALAFGQRLVATVESFAASFGLGGLGDIDLPPEAGSAADQASLHSAAGLYLASELESAELLPTVELLAGVFASGGLMLANAPAADKLVQFWSARNERLTPVERRAFFVRLFGGETGAGLTGESGSNGAFASLMMRLANQLCQWERLTPWGSTHSATDESRIRMAAYALASSLAPRSLGMTPFAARDILATLQLAVDILKEPEIQRLFGAQTLWSTVQNILSRYRREQPDIMTHLVRGKSGQTILAWLADVLPLLNDYSRPILTGTEVIAAAAAWLQASQSVEAPIRTAPYAPVAVA